MIQKTLGPSFGMEVHAAGLPGIAYDADGTIRNLDDFTEEQWQTLEELIDAHNPDPPPPLRAYAAEKRWELEVGGAYYEGFPIHTDAGSQGKYLAELQAIALGVRQDGEGWKFADGVFRSVSNAQMQDMAVAAREHVKSCFALEATVLQQIADGAITTEQEINEIFFPSE